MRRLVLLASALLPRAMRERYREQWLADLRDAPEAGVTRGEIAWGALAFAVAAPRLWPTVTLDPQRMPNIAFALAFVGAALGLTYYPGFEYGHTQSSPIAAAKFVIDAVVLATQVLGSLTAVLLISVARGVGGRERVSVWLLALAATAPLAPAIFGYGSGESMYLYPSALAYVVAVILMGVAAVLRHPHPTRPRSTPRGIAVATVGMALLAGVALALATMGWLTRTQPVTGEPVGSPVYEEWLSIKTQFETQVAVLLIASVIVAAAIVIGVAAVGIRHVLFDLRTAVGAAVFLMLFGYIQLSGYLGLWTPTLGLAEGNPGLLSFMRLSLVATVFIAVDGVRSPQPRLARSERSP